MSKLHRLFPVLLANPGLGRKVVVPPVLLDSFVGTGAITSHTPDIVPSGASWAIITGTWGNLASGFLPYTSGTNGRAIINSGLADCEMRWRSKHWAVGSKASGVLVRGNDAGSDYYNIGTYQIVTDQVIEWSLPNGITLNATQPAHNRQIVSIVAANYYTWTLMLLGGTARLYDESGNVVLATNGALKGTQTYVGAYVEQPYGSWDFLEIKPICHRWTKFSVMGDSISDGVSEWPALVSCRHNNGRMVLYNHAQSGSSVRYQIDGQTDACEVDAADFTIIALGTNDGLFDFTALYTANLQELYGTLAKPIYAMGVLPKTTDANRDTENGFIVAAVIAAQAAGVNVTYWNTDGWIDPATDTTDGLHPNAAGQDKIAAQVMARL